MFSWLELLIKVMYPYLCETFSKGLNLQQLFYLVTDVDFYGESADGAVVPTVMQRVT